MESKDPGHIHHTPPTAPQPGETCTHRRVNTHPKETSDDPSLKNQPLFPERRVLKQHRGGSFLSGGSAVSAYRASVTVRPKLQASVDD